jgi:hypothetical protein
MARWPIPYSSRAAAQVNALDAVYSTASDRNRGLNVALDVAGLKHFGGCANQDSAGNFYTMSTGTASSAKDVGRVARRPRPRQPRSRGGERAAGRQSVGRHCAAGGRSPYGVATSRRATGTDGATVALPVACSAVCRPRADHPPVLTATAAPFRMARGLVAPNYEGLNAT